MTRIEVSSNKVRLKLREILRGGNLSSNSELMHMEIFLKYNQTNSLLLSQARKVQKSTILMKQSQTKNSLFYEKAEGEVNEVTQ